MALFTLIKRFDEIKSASDQGDAQAQYDLGYMYEEGRGVKQDSTKAMQCYLKAAEQGHAKAQYELGLMYARLPVNKKNEEEAIRWIQTAMDGFREAAEQGDAEAQCRLGEIYDTARSGSQSRKVKMIAAALGLSSGEKDAQWFGEESARWFQMATDGFRQIAEQGDAKAQFELGGIYCWLLGGRENEEKGVYWFERAAKQGHVDAQYELGQMYSTGWCVAQQETLEALKWYTRAAEQGHLLAQTRLAKMYAGCDELIEPYYAEALKWYLKVAEYNDAAAQHNIGVMYARGLGVAQNFAEARKWLKKAAGLGNENARKALQLIEPFLNQQGDAPNAGELEQIGFVF